MSYLEPQPLGSLDAVFRSGIALLGKHAPSAAAASAVVTDPYFPEVVCQVLRAANIEEGKPAGVCRPTPQPVRAGGVGLKSAVFPLKLYVEHKKHPWLFPLIGVTGLAAVYLLGYSDGKRKR